MQESVASGNILQQAVDMVSLTATQRTTVWDFVKLVMISWRKCIKYTQIIICMKEPQSYMNSVLLRVTGKHSEQNIFFFYY